MSNKKKSNKFLTFIMYTIAGSDGKMSKAELLMFLLIPVVLWYLIFPLWHVVPVSANNPSSVSQIVVDESYTYLIIILLGTILGNKGMGFLGKIIDNKK